MTLPSPGVPFQSGQVISSAQVNATLTDLATETTSSLDRGGRGGMTAPLRVADGTSAAPAVAFTAEINSGLYRAGATDVRLTVGGVDALKLTSGGIAGPVTFPSGAGITATGTDSPVTLKGNLSATNLNGDVAVTSTVTRTAGQLLDVQNNGVGKFQVDYQGLAHLVNQAAAIQPASMWTAITPNAGWTANNGLAYWKDPNGMVHLKGYVSGAAANPAFTLPAGFRPAALRHFRCSNGVGGEAYVSVDVTGAVSCFQGGGFNTSAFVDPISFLAEQ